MGRRCWLFIANLWDVRFTVPVLIARGPVVSTEAVEVLHHCRRGTIALLSKHKSSERKWVESSTVQCRRPHEASMCHLLVTSCDAHIGTPQKVVRQKQHLQQYVASLKMIIFFFFVKFVPLPCLLLFRHPLAQDRLPCVHIFLRPSTPLQSWDNRHEQLG